MHDSYPEGYMLPLCRPLTRRVMRGGVPYNVFVMLVMAMMILIIMQTYILLPIIPVLFLIIRVAYEHDDYVLDIWWSHIRMVLAKKSRLDL